MSRTIAILAGAPDDRERASALAIALGRRLVEGPSRHDDEVALVEAAECDDLDLSVSAVIAPALDEAEDVTRALLNWAMEQGDVLTPWEHEQVMP